ncbi:hypothetical protein LXA43DRAFT_1103652 [Ganoderma leucocontextum]|nr:hypothetical protein LXA43DRAFT_1103652 [Ganoderma leucocontextum]
MSTATVVAGGNVAKKGKKGDATGKAPLAESGTSKPGRQPASTSAGTIISTVRWSQVPNARRTILPSGDEVHAQDDEDEASAVNSEASQGHEDEDCDGAHSDSDDELRSDVEANELAKKLASETPVWTEKHKSAKSQKKVTAKEEAAKTPAHRRTNITNWTYQLLADELDNSGCSGSEFDPEEDDDDELPSEEYTVDTGDDIEDELMDDEVQEQATVAPPQAAKAGKAKSNKVPSTRGPKAKQLLEQPVWKDMLLDAIAKSHPGISAGLPANFDLSAFAEEVHAHVMNQVVKTPTPAARSVSIPSHLGFVVQPHSRSTSLHHGPSTSSAPPPQPDNFPPGPDHDKDHDDDVFADTALPAPPIVATVPQPQAAPNAAGQPQDKLAADYVIVPPTQPGGTLQLMAQEENIRITVRLTIGDLDRYLAFENGFPDAMTCSRVIADLLAGAAHSLGFMGLQDHLQTDKDFTRSLSALPKQCMSTFRGGIKKLADAQVVAFYALSPGECKEKVEWLFYHLAYVYPFSYTAEKKSVTWSAPNKGAIVRHLLHLAFCNGPTSIAAKNPEHFKSSIEQMPQANEKEMPMPMVALVGAAIHAALSEWKTGIHKPAAFSADVFADAYHEHTILLSGIKNKNVRAYHIMMHRLYREATGITPPTGAAAPPGGTALDQVDFANMDMD